MPPLLRSAKETVIQGQVGLVGMAGNCFEVPGIRRITLRRLSLRALPLAFTLQSRLARAGAITHCLALSALCGHKSNLMSNRARRCDQLLLFEKCASPGPVQHIDLKTVGCVGSNLIPRPEVFLPFTHAACRSQPL